jgi:hypothetical protein
MVNSHLFLNTGNLAYEALNVWSDNYLHWKKSIEDKDQEHKRYKGGMDASETILCSIMGPNMAGKLMAQQRAFIDKNFNELL